MLRIFFIESHNWSQNRQIFGAVNIQQFAAIEQGYEVSVFSLLLKSVYKNLLY